MLLIRNLPTRLSKNGNSYNSWAEFYCEDCEKFVERRLNYGKIAKSCGCIPKNFKHGEGKTRLYNTWSAMKKRILNPKYKAYKDYGGIGITICPEWAESYIVFRDWALSNGYQDNLIIDRKNPNGNYEPSNCKWVTILESNRNKRNTITMEIANEIRELNSTGKYTQKELSEKYGVSKGMISLIINNKNWR